MFFTHIFDLIAKMITLAIFIVVIIASSELLPHRSTIIVVPVCAGLSLLVWWSLLRPLSSWCYARYRLGVRLPFQEARRASMLFSPLRNFTHWTPLAHVRTLPEGERLEALLDAVDVVDDYYKGREAEWRAAPTYARVLRIAFWLAMPAIIICSERGWWPFDWLSNLERAHLGEDYPMLNGMAFILMMYYSLLRLEQDLGIRSIDMATQRKRELSQ